MQEINEELFDESILTIVPNFRLDNRYGVETFPAPYNINFDLNDLKGLLDTGIEEENVDLNRLLMDLKLFRILHIVMDYGPPDNKDISLLTSKLIFEFNSDILPVKISNETPEYVKNWRKYQKENHAYMAYASYVFYGRLYHAELEGTSLFEHFYTNLAFFSNISGDTGKGLEYSQKVPKRDKMIIKDYFKYRLITAKGFKDEYFDRSRREKALLFRTSGPGKALTDFHYNDFKRLVNLFSNVKVSYGGDDPNKKLLNTKLYQVLERDSLKNHDPGANESLTPEKGNYHDDHNNYEHTLDMLISIYPQAFLDDIDGIRHEIVQYDHESGRFSDSEIKPTFILHGSGLEGKTFFECKTAKSLLEKMVNLLLSRDVNVNSYDYYRFHDIIVDKTALCSSVERDFDMIGEYRPQKMVKRRWVPVDSKGTAIEREAMFDYQKLYARSNMAVLLKVSSSHGIRNFATCRLDILYAQWRNMVRRYGKDRVPTPQTKDSVMNLVSYGASGGYKMNTDQSARSRFYELLLGNFVLSYGDNKAKDGPHIPSVGVTQNFQTTCEEYYSKMKKSGKLPMYDPYYIMNEPEGLNLDLNVSDVFRVLVYAYPFSFTSTFKLLNKSLSVPRGGASATPAAPASAAGSSGLMAPIAVRF